MKEPTPQTQPTPASTAIVAVMRWLVALVTGAIIGALLVLLFMNHTALLSKWLMTAIAVGIVFSMLVFLLMAAARIALRRGLRQAAAEPVSQALGTAIAKWTGKDLSTTDVDALGQNALAIAETWLLGISTAFFIGLAVTLAGTMVLMAQTFASYEQVQRLDRQNQLLADELLQSEANAARSAYHSQLESVLSNVDSFLDGARNGGKYDDFALKARLRAVLASASRYQRLDDAPEGYRFSPERGQLFALLVNRGVWQLDELPFESANLAEQLILPPRAADPALPHTTAAAAINLSGANLRGAQILDINLTAANLSNALLPAPEEFRSEFITLPTARGFPLAGPMYSRGVQVTRFADEETIDVEQRFGGTNFEGAYVPSPEWLNEMRDRIGGSRIQFSRWRPHKDASGKYWRLHLDTTAVAADSIVLDEIQACSGGREQAPEDPDDELLRAVALISAQASDIYRPYSREKGWAIVTASDPATARCLQSAGAQWDNAFFGFDMRADTLNLDGLRLARASFVNGWAKQFSARNAELPPAEAFDFFSLEPGADTFLIDDAIVPTSDWLETMGSRLLFRASKVLFRPACASPDLPLCGELKNYTLEPVREGGTSGQRYRVKRKAAAKTSASVASAR